MDFNRKYYDSGMFYDYSGVPMEVLMTNTCCGGKNPDPVLTENKITVSTFPDVEGYTIQLNAAFAVASPLIIQVKHIVNGVVNSKSYEMKIGEKTVQYLKVFEPTVTLSDSIVTAILPSSDLTYKYVTQSEVKDYGLVYYSAIQNGSIVDETVVNSKFKSIKLFGGDNTIEYVIEYVLVDDFNNLPDVDVAIILKEKAVDFVLLYNKAKVTKYEILGLLDIVDDKFIEDGAVTVKGISYTKLVRSDSDTQRNVLDSKTPNPKDMLITYNFNVLA